MLIDEIRDDELGRGYAAKSDQEVANDLNTAYRTRPVTSVSSADVYDAIVPAEYEGLSVGQKAILSDIFSLSEVRVQGNTRTALLAIFGAGTNTRTNLQALTQLPTTRARELGLGFVKPGQVAVARRALGFEMSGGFWRRLLS